MLFCLYLFKLFFFNCLLKKLKRKKTPNTSSKYSLLKSCEMLKVLTCSFVKWLTIKCQSCCSLTNFLLTIFFSSTYELPVINLLFALKFCICKNCLILMSMLQQLYRFGLPQIPHCFVLMHAGTVGNVWVFRWSLPTSQQIVARFLHVVPLLGKPCGW